MINDDGLNIYKNINAPMKRNVLELSTIDWLGGESEKREKRNRQTILSQGIIIK